MRALVDSHQIEIQALSTTPVEFQLSSGYTYVAVFSPIVGGSDVLLDAKMLNIAGPFYLNAATVKASSAAQSVSFVATSGVYRLTPGGNTTAFSVSLIVPKTVTNTVEGYV